MRSKLTDFEVSWDKTYEEELANFEDNGDEGEIWCVARNLGYHLSSSTTSGLRFGTETVEMMVEWVAENVPVSANPYTVEIGSGNGTLLFALLEAGYAANQLSGIDYSQGAVELARSIAAMRGQGITFSKLNFLEDNPPTLPGQEGSGESVWDLVLDKGTFDAIALGPKDDKGRSPAAKYPERLFAMLKPGGFFLITCE